MISLMGGQPQRLSSHNSGWTFTLREILRSKGYSKVELLHQRDFAHMHEYDAVCINNGVNFKEGGWNFIGGPPATLGPLLLSLSDFVGDVFSFNEKVDLNDLVASRKELADLKDYWMPEVQTLNTTQNGPNIIIGDSHTVSIFRPGWGISRNDGQTLFGAVRDNGSWIKSIIADRSIGRIHLYLGNIDVRFHLCRQSNPLSSLHDLVYDYIRVIKEFTDQGIEVTVQGLIPIEDESRKIPGTGLYLKKPFFGSQEERQELVNWFNCRMQAEADKAGYTFQQWSFDAPLDFQYMEATRSVHIRPEHYYYDDFRNTFSKLH